MKVPLLGGAYTARSIIANAQRSVNLYPENNPQDADAPITHYLTPGLTAVSTPAFSAPGRCLYRASNGALYGVVGNAVYHIGSNLAFINLGTLSTNNGIVYITDNGISAVVTDGSPAGFEINLTSNTMLPITSSAWQSARRGDSVDTFLVFNVPGTNQWFSSLSNEVDFDPLYVASKSGFPDPLATLICMHREIWLIGTQTTEIWYNAGNPKFPFAIFPGTFIEHGCAAPYSIAKHDLAVFWLSLDKDGLAIAIEGTDYRANRISTYAVEQEWRKYPTVTDAVGFTYQQGGHVFWVLTFPIADKTWVYDRATHLWHERTSIDLDGNEHRWRIGQAANAYNLSLGMDWETGQLYKLDLQNYTDNGIPIVRRRGFPHLLNDGKRASYAMFQADMECGTDDGSVDGATAQPGTILGADSSTELAATLSPSVLLGSPGTLSPQVNLRFSIDRGKTFGNPLMQDLGRLGDYLVSPQWQQLGQARDMVFELFWSTAAPTALNGAWVDSRPMVS